MELNEKELGAVAGGKSEMVPVKVGDTWRLVKDKHLKGEEFSSEEEARKCAEERNTPRMHNPNMM